MDKLIQYLCDQESEFKEQLIPFHNVNTYEKLNELLETINLKYHNYIKIYFEYCLVYQKFEMKPKKTFTEIENKMSKIEKEYLDKFKKKYFSKISTDEYEEVKGIGLIKDLDSHIQMKKDIQEKNLEPYYKKFISGMYSNSNLKISTFMELDFVKLPLYYKMPTTHVDGKCLCGHKIENVHHVISKKKYQTKRMKSPDHIILKIGNCCIKRFVDGGISKKCFKCLKDLKDENSGRNKNYKIVTSNLILCNECFLEEEICIFCGIPTSLYSHNEIFCKNQYNTKTSTKTKLLKLYEKEGNVCMFKGCYEFCKKGKKCKIHNKEYQCKLCLIEINPRQYKFGQKCFDCNKKNKELLKKKNDDKLYLLNNDHLLSKKCKCGKIITNPKFDKCYNCYSESVGPPGPK